MEHYVCRGECGGVSEGPGVCQAEKCSRKGAPLEPCECEDGHHGVAECADESGTPKEK